MKDAPVPFTLSGEQAYKAYSHEGIVCKLFEPRLNRQRALFHFFLDFKKERCYLVYTTNKWFPQVLSCSPN